MGEDIKYREEINAEALNNETVLTMTLYMYTSVVGNLQLQIIVRSNRKMSCSSCGSQLFLSPASCFHCLLKMARERVSLMNCLATGSPPTQRIQRTLSFFSICRFEVSDTVMSWTVLDKKVFKQPRLIQILAVLPALFVDLSDHSCPHTPVLPGQQNNINKRWSIAMTSYTFLTGTENCRLQ